MSLLESVTFGFIQGLTNFLPVSLAGHLVLVRTLFKVENTNVLLFDVVVYLAIATAIIVYFRKDIWLLTQALLRKLGRLPVNKREETLLYAILVAIIPAVVLGLLFGSFIKMIFSSPLLVAGVLIAGSFLFIYAEFIYQKNPPTNKITIKKGFKIGLFQSLSIIPGMSLSGPSISGGMFLGLSRYESARFAFLLAIPIILSIGLKKTLILFTSDAQMDWFAIGVGWSVTFVMSLLAIHFMLSFLQRHTLWLFIWYRIILALFIIFVFIFG